MSLTKETEQAYRDLLAMKHEVKFSLDKNSLADIFQALDEARAQAAGMEVDRNTWKERAEHNLSNAEIFLKQREELRAEMETLQRVNAALLLEINGLRVQKASDLGEWAEHCSSLRLECETLRHELKMLHRGPSELQVLLAKSEAECAELNETVALIREAVGAKSESVLVDIEQMKDRLAMADEYISCTRHFGLPGLDALKEAYDDAKAKDGVG